MGFFDRFRSSAARAEAGKKQSEQKKGAEVFDLEQYFSPKGVKQDPKSSGTRVIPAAEIEAARRKKDAGPQAPETEIKSGIATAKEDVQATYRYEIASWKPETIARMDDLQERIKTMEDSLFDFCEEVGLAAMLSDSDRQDIEDVRVLSETFLHMIEPIAAGGIGGKDIRVRAEALRQTFQTVEKKLQG